MSARDNERYYWIKLRKDFFKRHDMRILESMENGKDYVLLYLKLMLESVDHSGRLRYSDTIPYNAKMLATITDTNIDTVNGAMKVFSDLGLIELLDDQTLYLRQVEELLDSETYAAKRKRYYRNDSLPEGDIVPRLSPVCPQESETETDIDTEIDTESESEPEKHGTAGHPTRKEVADFVLARKSRVNADRFYEYYEAIGWCLNGSPIRNWKSLMYRWEEKDGFYAAAEESSTPLPESICRKEKK